MVVLPPNSRLPERPVDSPVKHSPRTCGLRSFRRERLLKTSSIARIALTAEKPKPESAIPRSRSDGNLPTNKLSMTNSPSILPTHYVRRARSNPMLRPGATGGTPDKRQTTGPISSLGASLRFPLGPEMLHAIKMPAALPASVPAAKLYVDSTTGRSIHLRC